MLTDLKFACPHCTVGLKAEADKAGRTSRCPNCKNKVTVPRQSALVKEARPVLVPVARRVLVPGGISDAEERKLARRRNRRNKETTPVKLTLPKGLGGFEGKVSQGTANTIAKTFLGGLLVALGVIVMAMFGVKG